MPTDLWKPIKSKSDTKRVTVEDEFGFIQIFDLEHETYILPENYDPENCKWCKKGIPELRTTFKTTLVDQSKTKNSVPREKIIELLKTRSIIPPSLEWDNILVGFVYADETDPNNHRWWINFRNKQDQSIHSIWTDKVESRCSISTRSWMDGIWHGRFVVAKNDLESIQEENGKLFLIGKKKDTPKHDVSKIPKGTESLRLRFNIRENLWFCDFLDKKDEEITSVPTKNIDSDAVMFGHVINIGDRPKVSMKIYPKDISKFSLELNSITIRGNYETT